MENLLWGLLLCVAVVASVLTVRIYYRHKYDPIFRQLSEQPSDKEEDESDEPAVTPVKEVDETADNPTNIAKEETSQDAKATADADGELFKKLTDAICKEQLYLTPKFGRKELVERFHLSSRRVSSVFSSAGTSVPEFFRDCRLEHARHLMIERPDLTLAEVASASGFVHASTFTVDFRNKYGSSPTQYREENLKIKSDK